MTTEAGADRFWPLFGLQGLGQEMRGAMLHLAFAGLGALRAESEAFDDNPASQGVSRAMGYEPDGFYYAWRPSGAGVMSRFALSRTKWETTRRGDIRIDGLAPCLPLLGLDDGGEP